MGTYYIVVCQEKEEFLDPFEVEDQGVKEGAMIHGKIANLAMFKLSVLTDNQWPHFELVPDSSDLYDEALEFENVTKKTIEEFNHMYPDSPIKWTDPEADGPYRPDFGEEEAE